jgi:hypothetical protein
MNQSSTAAAQAQSKGLNENLTLKTYEKKVKEDMRLIHENLHEMLKLLRIDDDRTMRVMKFCFLFLLT